MEEDPHLWLEEVMDEKALDWVRARNADSAVLSGSEDFKKLEARFLSILDSESKIPYVQKIGDWYYNYWRDAKHTRGIWRRTALEQYRLEDPSWETVIDLDELADAEKENWVWHGANVLRPGADRCIVSLSRGGGDADVKREFDLESKSFVEGGFFLPEAKSQISWRNRDSVFVGTDFGPASLTDSGYPRIVKVWKRGAPLEDAATVFEVGAKDMVAGAYTDLTPGFERDLVVRAVTFFEKEYHLWRDGELRRIDVPADAEVSFYREWLFVTLRKDWGAGSAVYPAGGLMAIPFEDFLEGDREFTVLFEPTERSSLAAFSSTKNHVLLNVLDNVSNKLFILTPPKKGRDWTRASMPGVPGQATAGARPVDEFETDEYFLDVTGFLTPSTLSLGEVGKESPELLKSGPEFFNAEGLEVTRFETKSLDGTSIPYFQVAPKDLPFDGTTQTLLTGYGGFEVPMVPFYNPLAGAGWMEKGGVFVVANLRGGGEFGPKWHQAVLKENRHKVYEDFEAVAEDLIRRKVTSPERLGIEGGSNGGLLVGNALTRRPDLFGAIVCQVPLLDMRRFHLLLAGASWMAEYGDPDVPEEWAYIQTFSPYHNVKEDGDYPPVLFSTSTRDDRVHPGHARKMVARMLAQGHEVHYYENIEGGHGGAANNAQLAHMFALAYTFLQRELGKGGGSR